MRLVESEGKPGSAELASFLQHRPDLAEKYQGYLAGLEKREVLPLRLLALCRIRIAQIHGRLIESDDRRVAVGIGDQEVVALAAGDSSGFSEQERAALEVAELISFAHHQISDAQVARLNEILGHEGCVTLLTALSFIDVNCRLELVYGLES